MLGSVDLGDSSTFKTYLAVMQPTPFCNINCRYCYLPDRTANQKMTLDTAERCFRFLFDHPENFGDKIAFAWHAGEPLVMDVDFYKAAFELQRRLAPPQLSISNWIQTNGTLLTEEWCQLFHEWNVKIGVSIDGPAFLHDRSRVDRRGKGTFERVVAGIRLLQAYKIPFDAFTVLSQETLAHPEELWHFYQEHDISSIAFTFEEIQGINLASSLSVHRIEEQVERFFDTLFTLKESHGSSICIREIDSLMKRVVDRELNFRTIENVPLGILSFGWEGDIATYSPELLGMKHFRYDSFSLGNVHHVHRNDVLEHPTLKSMQLAIEDGVATCQKTCDYFALCGGGSPSVKLYENGSFASAETLNCKLKVKTVGNLLLRNLESKSGFGPATVSSVPSRIRQIRPALLAGSASPATPNIGRSLE